MKFIQFIIFIWLPIFLVAYENDPIAERTFTVDHKRNTFLMNGEPFRYISGSFHYFRAQPETWHTHLKTMRAGGLNVIDTYVEWSTHNPRDGVYKWDGIANLVLFLELAQAEGFYVILRPGPYICAERDNGGLPYWLFTKYPNIKLRTSDPSYLYEVSIWYSHLMPRIQPFLYGNGGHIIMVQIENEYGSFYACDRKYLNWLRDETEKYVLGKALLFTTDAVDERVQCGKIDGVFITTDFGIESVNDLDIIWRNLSSVQPTGPRVNSEYYPGWLTHWQEPNQRRDALNVTEFFRKILESGANVNIFMYFGGTNFGFTAGANVFGYGKYGPQITSYDYDAILDETGGLTAKFFLFRDIIKQFIHTKNSNTPPPTRRTFYENIILEPILNLLSANGRRVLSKQPEGKFYQRPLTFEELDQFSGLLLYETTLPTIEIDPTLLTVNGLRDRALVYVDQNLVGVLSRENNIYSLPLSAGLGTKLQLLVENQGRINYAIANDTKGIMGNVTLQGYDGKSIILQNWTTTGLPLDEDSIKPLIADIKPFKETENLTNQQLIHGPRLLYGEFTANEIGDTFLNTLGWGKGVAYVNGLNIGRYWPLAGPQITLYVPHVVLKLGINTIVLIEYQKLNLQEINGCTKAVISFDDHPQLDG